MRMETIRAVTNIQSLRGCEKNGIRTLLVCSDNIFVALGAVRRDYLVSLGQNFVSLLLFGDERSVILADVF